jgi:AraC-like DNA-binding protein
MNDLHPIISSALDYRLTWCEHHHAEPYHCDWRVDPCLVVIYTPDVPYRLSLKEAGEVRVIEASNGEALLVPAGTLHRFDSPACHIRGVNIQFTLFGGIDVLSFYRAPTIVRAADAESLRETIESLVAVVGRRSALYSVGDQQGGPDLDFGVIAQERNLAFGLLSQVLGFSDVLPLGSRRLMLMQTLSPALRMIEDLLEAKLSIETLSAACGLSVHRFGVLFKQTLGDSPHRFILKRRMEKAMSLLAHSRLSVSQIAVQLGFHDQPHFTRSFKGFAGQSPAFYRKDIQRRVLK